MKRDKSRRVINVAVFRFWTRGAWLFVRRISQASQNKIFQCLPTCVLVQPSQTSLPRPPRAPLNSTPSSRTSGPSFSRIPRVPSVCLQQLSLDFTPVCTTELGQVAKLSPEWKKRDTVVVGLSCNTLDSHGTASSISITLTGCY